MSSTKLRIKLENTSFLLNYLTLFFYKRMNDLFTFHIVLCNTPSGCFTLNVLYMVFTLSGKVAVQQKANNQTEEITLE